MKTIDAIKELSLDDTSEHLKKDSNSYENSPKDN
jgi:hypothetical protein